MFDPNLANNSANATPSTVSSALVSATCVAGSVQQVKVELTDDPKASGWTINYVFNGVANTATGIMTSPFIFQPTKKAVFYVTSITDGNGLVVNYPTSAPFNLAVTTTVHSCVALTNPSLPSKASN